MIFVGQQCVSGYFCLLEHCLCLFTCTRARYSEVERWKGRQMQLLKATASKNCSVLSCKQFFSYKQTVCFVRGFWRSTAPVYTALVISCNVLRVCCICCYTSSIEVGRLITITLPCTRNNYGVGCLYMYTCLCSTNFTLNWFEDLFNGITYLKCTFEPIQQATVFVPKFLKYVMW